jgi:hypothetical protein
MSTSNKGGYLQSASGELKSARLVLDHATNGVDLGIAAQHCYNAVDCLLMHLMEWNRLYLEDGQDYSIDDLSAVLAACGADTRCLTPVLRHFPFLMDVFRQRPAPEMLTKGALAQIVSGIRQAAGFVEEETVLAALR